MNGEILFRPIDEPQPANWGHRYWYVEYHDADHDCPYPAGIAVVSDIQSAYPRAGSGDRDAPCHSQILYMVFVIDSFRREGVATALIRACKERWPNILITGAVSDSGEALLASMPELFPRHMAEDAT